MIYLSLGSNLGDRLENIDKAKRLIWRQLGRSYLNSKVFESAPWGYNSVNYFYNCCISVITKLDPLPLMEEILSIEKILGRERGLGGYSDRMIDIDLLFFGDLILEHPRLSIPHPAIPKRRFVLEPLSEIAPNLIHPVTGLTVMKMLNQCQDMGKISSI